jgi:hypothetical protein
MGWVVDKFGWEAKVAADSQTLRELQFLKQFLKDSMDSQSGEQESGVK